MKSVLYLFFALCFTGNIATKINTEANELTDCDPKKHCDLCVTRLTPGFNFVKGFNINGENGSKEKVEYSYVLTKGTIYLITICTGLLTSDGIIVTIYDSNRNKIASNMIGIEIADAIRYQCNATSHLLSPIHIQWIQGVLRRQRSWI